MKGIRSVTGKFPSTAFVEEIRKVSKRNKTGVPKKFKKGTFWLYFEFVNKALLLRFEKRTVITSSDLFLMESLSKMDKINLPALSL